MHWLWIDELLACTPGESAIASMMFDESAFFFADHSPGAPKVPGVLQVEMIAQTAGICIRAARQDISTVLARIVGAKFSAPILPGEPCRITVHVSKLAPEFASVEGAIFVKEQKRCESSLRIALIAGASGYPRMDAVLERWQQRQKDVLS